MIARSFARAGRSSWGLSSARALPAAVAQPTPAPPGAASCAAAGISAAGARRELSFSFPGPRSLADVTKLPLLESEPPARVCEIWEEYHASSPHAVGRTLDAAALDTLATRAASAMCCFYMRLQWNVGRGGRSHQRMSRLGHISACHGSHRGMR